MAVTEPVSLTLAPQFPIQKSVTELQEYTTYCLVADIAPHADRPTGVL